MTHVWIVMWAEPATREAGVKAVFRDDQEREARSYAAKLQEDEFGSGPDYYVERWALGARVA